MDEKSEEFIKNYFLHIPSMIAQISQKPNLKSQIIQNNQNLFGQYTNFFIPALEQLNNFELYKILNRKVNSKPEKTVLEIIGQLDELLDTKKMISFHDRIEQNKSEIETNFLKQSIEQEIQRLVDADITDYSKMLPHAISWGSEFLTKLLIQNGADCKQLRFPELRYLYTELEMDELFE